MADPSDNSGAITVSDGGKVAERKFSPEDYQLAATYLNIRDKQLDKCVHLATLGRATAFTEGANKHDQNMGTLVWTREKMMDYLNQAEEMAKNNPNLPDDSIMKLDGRALVSLFNTQIMGLRIMAETIVPGIEHLGDRRTEEEKETKKRKSFAPGATVSAARCEVNVNVANRNGEQTSNRLVVDATGDNDLS